MQPYDDVHLCIGFGGIRADIGAKSRFLFVVRTEVLKHFWRHLSLAISLHISAINKA
jgi:hypothetical protein